MINPGNVVYSIAIFKRNGRFLWVFSNGRLSVLFVHVFSCCINCLKEHLTRGEDINAATPELGSTPLMVAVEKQQVRAMRFLFSKGADVNQEDKFGFTALHLTAIKRSLYGALRFLLENGADVNAMDVRNVTPLMSACVHSNMNIVRDLIGSGANVHLRDFKGDTALFWAVCSNSASALDIL